MTTMVRTWTGRETTLLRSALRLSMRAFAEHLGVATRTVAKWEARGAAIRPLPEMQAILDAALTLASDEVRERFAGGLETFEDDGSEAGDELEVRLSWVGAALDRELVDLFEQQTQAYRLLDRRLGARRLLAQTEAHVRQMAEVLAYSLAGPDREALAAALAEAAALAGWQALDLGRPDQAWSLHETARAAAARSGDPAVIAHVTAQQAYCLLEIDRPAEAVRQVRHARESAAGQVPATVRAWLWAAEAEALAATGDEPAVRAAMDQAERLLEDGPAAVAYLSLDRAHLIRWRGHCLARVGARDAIDDLGQALERLDPSFVRAAAGLHCDLAIAHGAGHEPEAARAHAEQASRLAEATMSVRQQRRVAQLAGVPGAGVPGARV